MGKLKTKKALKAFSIQGTPNSFVVDKVTLYNKLSYNPQLAQPSGIHGFGISFNDDLTNGELMIKSFGSNAIANFKYSNGDYKLMENEQILNYPMERQHFFPDINLDQIGMYFLNFGEFHIANFYHESIDAFRFSLGIIAMGDLFVTDIEPSYDIPMLKIELIRNNTLQFNSQASPKILIAPPCPPIWKPGFQLVDPVPMPPTDGAIIGGNK